MENLNISIMSWRKTNDFEILNENWNKVSAVTSIQRDIDLLAEEIRKGRSELHTIEEDKVGRGLTWLKNRFKGYGNMAKNIGKNIGRVAHGKATEGGINVRGQFDLDQLQSVWNNFYNDVFKMVPREKMEQQFPEIGQVIDYLANMIDQADSEGTGAGADTGTESTPGRDATAVGSGTEEGPTRTGTPGSTVNRLETGGGVSDEPVRTADVTGSEAGERFDNEVTSAFQQQGQQDDLYSPQQQELVRQQADDARREIEQARAEREQELAIARQEQEREQERARQEQEREQERARQEQEREQERVGQQEREREPEVDSSEAAMKKAQVFIDRVSQNIEDGKNPSISDITAIVDILPGDVANNLKISEFTLDELIELAESYQKVLDAKAQLLTNPSDIRLIQQYNESVKTYNNKPKRFVTLVEYKHNPLASNVGFMSNNWGQL